MTAVSIDQLRDIHLPPPPGIWPPAPGWWMLLAATIAGALWFAYRHRRARPLRIALRELDAVAQTHARTQDAVELARGVGAVLRRYALSRFPEACPAGLDTRAWLDFLDAHGGQGEFVTGTGAVLGTLPYRPAGAAGALTHDEARALLALSRRWLRTNAP